MSLILNEFICTFNDVYRDFIFWPQIRVLLIVMEDPKNWHGFLMCRAIDGTPS